MSELQQAQNSKDFPKAVAPSGDIDGAVLRPVLPESSSRTPSLLRGSRYPRLTNPSPKPRSQAQVDSLGNFQWADLQARCPGISLDVSQRLEKHFPDHFHNILELSAQSHTIFPISPELAAQHGKYFKKIQEGTTPTELTTRAAKKNRYGNVAPNEYYRVPLVSVRGHDQNGEPIYSQSQQEREPGRLRADDDYINASDILPLKNLPGCKQTYIACQAPTQSTIDDMWEMIWQQHVELVVFLTKFVEGGGAHRSQQKAIPYWPTQTAQAAQMESEITGPMSPIRPASSAINNLRSELEYTEPPLGATGRFGNVQVTVLDIDTMTSADSVVRQFKIQNLTDPEDPKGLKPQNQRTVQMLHFTGWPDFNLPQSEQFLRVFKLYHFLRSSMVVPQSPIVVHCSAGIGRSGTFIAIDMMLDHIRHQQKLNAPIDIRNVVKVVAGLRTCRPGMVQTDSQYSFIYHFLQFLYSHPKRDRLGLQ